MPEPVCPHCGKVTEGEPHDTDLYIIVKCTECSTVLSILPKYFQKCTWKREPGGDEVEPEEDDEREIRPAPKPKDRKKDERRKTGWD